MSHPSSKGVNATDTADLTIRTITVKNSSLEKPVTSSSEVARQIKPVSDPLTRPLERLRDLMRDL